MKRSGPDGTEEPSISHYFTLPIPGNGRRKTTLAPMCPPPLLPTPFLPHTPHMAVIYILFRDNRPAPSALSLSLLVSLSLSYVVAGAADLPINTETLSSMTKHIRILLANTHTHCTYANSCVCVCWPGQALWPSETAAQPTTSINLVDGLPRRLPFLAHKPCVCVCVCESVCVCSTGWLLCVLVRLNSKSECESPTPTPTTTPFSVPSPIPSLKPCPHPSIVCPLDVPCPSVLVSVLHLGQINNQCSLFIYVCLRSHFTFFFSRYYARPFAFGLMKFPPRIGYH